MKKHRLNYCSELSAMNFSNKLTSLIALAASGSSSANQTLLANHGMTMEPADDDSGDYILVQTQRLTVSI